MYFPLELPSNMVPIGPGPGPQAHGPGPPEVARRLLGEKAEKIYAETARLLTARSDPKGTARRPNRPKGARTSIIGK